jgi:hypothetical protein
VLCALSGEIPVLAQDADDPSLRIETSALPDALLGRSYFRRLLARGGQAPYRWSLAVPYLPTGLQLDEETGALLGSAVVVDDFSFTLEVTDSSRPPQSARQSFTLHVAEPLALPPDTLPRGTRAARYRFAFSAVGGTQPFRWEIVEGGLPPGVQLDPYSGGLAGSPTEAGLFRFVLRVSDSGSPPQSARRTFSINVVAPLEITWADPPRVREGGIFGSVRVFNGTRDHLDLTVLVVAVNEYGKAFALGYHRFIIKAGEETRNLQFGFTLPKGTYTVHADAVAEFERTVTIHRTRLQHGPLSLE